MARADRIDDPPPENRPGHVPDVVPDKPLVPPPEYRVGGSGQEGGAAGHTAGDAAGDAVEELSVRHPFRFEPLLVPFATAVGVLPATAHVTVDHERLEVRFGPWRLETPTANVAGAVQTGPYSFLKVAGPPHLSFADRGVTFATNRQAGLCIRFHEPVPAIAPFGVLTHPAATVTVADPAALERDLSRVGAGLAPARG